MATSDLRNEFTDVDRAAEPGHLARLLQTITVMEGAQAYKQRTFDLLAPDQGHVLLDVGCGNGDDVQALAKRVGPTGRVVGVDRSETMIAEARARADAADLPVTFQVGNAHALEFVEDTFDGCRADRVLHHVEDPPLVLAEMVRVARRGGVIYVHTPNAWSWYEGHYKLFWVPFMPRGLGRAYLLLRGRPAGYLSTLRRLTPTALRRAFFRVGVSELRFFAEERPRESLGPLRLPLGLYYRLSGISPFIELVAIKP